MAIPPQEFKPLSEILADTIADEVVTLGEVVDRLGWRGFGLIMIVLALPTLIPVLPPGSAATIGALYILLSLQVLIGRDEPWLPRRARRFRLSARAVAALRQRGVPFLRRLERFSRPRAVWWDDRVLSRGVAGLVLIFGVILLLPLPFLNTLPALAVLILGMGLLNRDGVFLLVGLLLAVAVVLIIIFGLGTLIGLFNRLFR